MLGKLGRELRMLGMDVEQKRGWGSTRGYRQARSRERVFLTRNTELKEQSGVLFIDSEKPDEQLAQVRREYNLSPEPDKDKALNRCLQCNVALEKLSREQARPSIPFFIYQIHHEFSRCPKCKRVFWPGSHAKGMVRRIGADRSPTRRSRQAQ